MLNILKWLVFFPESSEEKNTLSANWFSKGLGVKCFVIFLIFFQ